MNRCSFEEMGKVKELLSEYKSDNIVFNDKEQRYDAKMYVTFVPEYIDWLNGAFWAFGEQQKVINDLMSILNNNCSYK